MILPPITKESGSAIKLTEVLAGIMPGFNQEPGFYFSYKKLNL